MLEENMANREVAARQSWGIKRLTTKLCMVQIKMLVIFEKENHRLKTCLFTARKLCS
jgi:hypothetical protein